MKKGKTAVIVGAQWGDEGKGKIVDVLSQNFQVVARYAGGHNAGHTVIINGKKFILQLVPSGILRSGCRSVIGNGVVFDPIAFLKEVGNLRDAGVEVGGNLFISNRAHVILPNHRMIELASENAPGRVKIGTTSRGIGPAYEDKMGRRGLRVADLLDLKLLKTHIENACREKNMIAHALFNSEPLDADKMYEEYATVSAKIAPFVCDTAALLNRALAEGQSIVFEGAQGTMLDIDHGTYPIPALYGRNPRLKTPEQITRELDAMVRQGGFDAVYFVDDNFIANPRAARALLPHLIRWQQANRYRLRFACEATLNMAQMPDLLALMREAGFYAVFVGIETPEPHALDAIQKRQNLRLPILDAIATFNSYGLEVVSGIIMGLDTDGPETGAAIRRFIDVSNIPLLTINLLYALPRTPLYDRLARERRLLTDDEAAGKVSNVRFRLPYDAVVGMWYDTITDAYRPDKLLARFRHQCATTYVRRLKVARRLSWALIRRGAGVLARVFWHCGVRPGWRREFWRMALPLLRRGRIEEMVSVATVAHHLITFVGEIRSGKHEACFYADPSRSTMDARRSLARVRRDARALQAAE